VIIYTQQIKFLSQSLSQLTPVASVFIALMEVTPLHLCVSLVYTLLHSNHLATTWRGLKPSIIRSNLSRL